MYKDIPFERRPLEEIKEDIAHAAQLYKGTTRTIFIGDSNSLVIRAEVFGEVLHTLYASFPHLERVTSYARAATLAKKGLAELQQLRQAGLTRLHVGLETGDAETLGFIKKGATPEEMIAAGRKAKEAGFELSLYILLGIGGSKRWQEHADGTAAVLNRVDPHFIRVRTLTVRPGSQLFAMQVPGEFVVPPPDMILEEEKRIIAGTEVTSQLLSDHISNYLSLHGQLPDAKPEFLQSLDRELDRLRADPALIDRYRQKGHLDHL
jgi:coproporphyrinogen III oxidase-like Fe-S oxidoreductase